MHYFLSLALFLEFSIISMLYEIKLPKPYMVLHPPRPLLQFTPSKFENLIKLLYGILVLHKPHSIWGAAPHRPPASEMQY